MRHFACSCGNTVYFDNSQCLNCGRLLGFDPEQRDILALEPADNNTLRSADDPSVKYRLCENGRSADVCNWLVHEHDNERFCIACRMNQIIPDLDSPGNIKRWYKLEKAKRRLIYTILSLKLPIINYKTDRDHGLAFKFMQDVVEIDQYSDEVITYDRIMTGHDAGTITINIIEADDAERESIRENMNEPYRTILGHFRHEIGHYYWYQLIANTDRIDEFRQLFGDERNDYRDSLKRYYENGPQIDWPMQHITAYASAHPWEDWAETWAHYLHFVDILETSSHHAIALGDEKIDRDIENLHDWLQQCDFNAVMRWFNKLTRSLNELNRSLGFSDPYPFKHSAPVINKLKFIHRLVMQQ